MIAFATTKTYTTGKMYLRNQNIYRVLLQIHPEMCTKYYLSYKFFITIISMLYTIRIQQRMSLRSKHKKNKRKIKKN